MIVRINFSGIVKTPSGKKKILDDYIDVHINSVADAKKMWRQWMDKNSGIRGASGIFHPLGGFGDIEVRSTVEAPDEME